MTLPEFSPGNLPELRGRRCVLLPLREDHVTEDYVGWLNDPEINKYLESRFVRHDLDGVRAFVRQQWAVTTVLFYGIWSIDGVHIGNIKLGPVNRHHSVADLGFLIGDRNYWGKGIGSEAIALMLGLAADLGIQKVTAGAYENNPGSIRALLKAGFVEEGYRPQQAVFDGARIGTYIFGFPCS